MATNGDAIILTSMMSNKQIGGDVSYSHNLNSELDSTGRISIVHTDLDNAISIDNDVFKNSIENPRKSLPTSPIDLMLSTNFASLTSRDILENAPSKLFASKTKGCVMLEQFESTSGEDSDHMDNAKFNKQVKKVRRETSCKRIQKKSQLVNRKKSNVSLHSLPFELSNSFTKKDLAKCGPQRSFSFHKVSFKNNTTVVPSTETNLVIENETATGNIVTSLIDTIPRTEIDIDRPEIEPDNSIVAVPFEDDVTTPNSIPTRSQTIYNKQIELQKKKEQAIKKGFLSRIRVVYIDELIRHLKTVLSLQIWKGHIKQVEGIFGSAVVSYFVFLRFLFLMNLVLFFVSICFIILPQIIADYTIFLNQTIKSRNNFTVARDLLGLITGDNWFENTELFYGEYSNENFRLISIGDFNLFYDMPKAYLLTSLAILIIILVMLAFNLGVSFRESFGTIGYSTPAAFCNRVFGAWDFGIYNESAAKLRLNTIFIDLREEVDEFQAKRHKRSIQEKLKVLFIRILFNLLTVFLLLASGVVIFFTTIYGLAKRCPDSNEIETLIVLGINIPGVISSITIVMLNFILQFIFPFFARFENFQTQRGELRMTLIRSVSIRLASLFVLTLTLFITYFFLQDDFLSTDLQIVNTNITTDTVFEFIQTVTSIEINIDSFRSCETFNCWETYFGQEFYRLAVTNLVFSIITTILPETLRNFLNRLGPATYSRFIKSRVKERFQKRVDALVKIATQPPEFVVAKSVLDLIYSQGLMILGFFFCPFLPFISMSTFLILFYVKKYSCVWNCQPSSRGVYRSARNNLFYILILMFTYFLCVIAVIAIFVLFTPSPFCGPFRGLFFTVPISNIVSSSAVVFNITNILQSAGFTYVIIVIMLLLAYAQYTILRSYKRNVKSLKKTLILESADKQYFTEKFYEIFEEAEKLEKIHNDLIEDYQEFQMNYQENALKVASESSTALFKSSRNSNSLTATASRKKLRDLRQKDAGELVDVYKSDSLKKFAKTKSKSKSIEN